LVRSPKARGKLVDHMADANKVKTATAPLVAVLAADVNFHGELHRTFPHFPGTRDVFAGDDAAREGVAKFQRCAAGRLLHPRRACRRTRSRLDDRLRHRGHQRRLLPGQRTQGSCGRNIGHPGEGAWFGRLPRLDYDEVASAV
jgi:3-hydroxypropanoate dehydrogenase